MDTAKRIEQLEAKVAAQSKIIAHYEKKLGIGEDETPMDTRGYLAYMSLLKQQIEYIERYKLTDTVIGGKKTESAEYERVEKLHNDLPEKVSALNRLRIELKLDHDANEGKPKPTATTPQSLLSLNK